MRRCDGAAPIRSRSPQRILQLGLGLPNESQDSAISYKGPFGCHLKRHGVRYHYLGDLTTGFKLQGFASTSLTASLEIR
jgi:hypothetical protein